tara:strand:- start:489 stop:869 length:381 start_codon:yes stop_codon:yes gene_type:complete
MIITKIKEGYIDVPKISKEDTIKNGLYILVYNGSIIKVGIYGEGVNSNNKSRFSAYRSKGKNIIPGNGSYKTMEVLNEKLKVGDTVEARFKRVPEDRIIDGYKWKVDLYHEEKKLKDIYKDSLWLK